MTDISASAAEILTPELERLLEKYDRPGPRYTSYPTAPAWEELPSSRMREALHDYEEGLTAVVWHLLEQTRSRAAIVTLGSEGMIAFDERRETGAGTMMSQTPPGPREPPTGDWTSRLHAEHVPSLAAHVVDQLGCGDALLAAASLTLVSGGSLALAAILGSLAAAAEASKLGNAVIGAADLRRGVQRLVGSRLIFDLKPRASIVARADDYVPVAYTQSS